MSRKLRTVLALIVNLLAFFCTVWAVGIYFFSGPDVLGSVGTGCFRYFTTDSNVLAAISTLVMAVFLVRRLCVPEAEIPLWAVRFKFIGTVAVTLTLVTVVLFLGPMSLPQGGWRAYFRFFEGNTFALHFSTPVLCIVSLVLLEPDGKLTFRDCLLALVPTAVYGAVYALLVIVFQVWFDWYGFTFGGRVALAPVSMAVMLLATLLLAVLLKKLRKTE